MSPFVDGLIPFLSKFLVVYLVVWLCYLAQKHHGSAKSAQVFELNILLDAALFMACLMSESFVSVVDSELLCSLTMVLQHVTSLSYYLAIAASHIETMYFLKVNKDWDFFASKRKLIPLMQTLSTEPMTTNTAAYICAGIKVFAVAASCVLVWALPQSGVCRMSLEPCEYFQTWMLYIYSPPFFLALIIILVVISFSMYRAHTFDVVEPLPQPLEGQNIEMANQNSDHEISIISLENQVPPCVTLQNFFPPLPSILDILYKYLRVTLLSLCILAVNLPEQILIIINFITSSGCESKQFVQAVENIWLPTSLMAQLILPYLVKKKLDRFSD